LQQCFSSTSGAFSLIGCHRFAHQSATAKVRHDEHKQAAADHGGHHDEHHDDHHGPMLSSDTIKPPALPKETWGEFLFEQGWRRPLRREEGGKVREDWYWFGYDSHDEYTDWHLHHKTMMVFVFGVFSLIPLLWAYRPDWPDLKEWTQREAFLEMARREKYGLPYISPDLYPPEEVLAQLPSDEELGDYQIVI